MKEESDDFTHKWLSEEAWIIHKVDGDKNVDVIHTAFSFSKHVHNHRNKGKH